MNSLSYKDNRNYLVNLLAAALSNTTTTSAWFGSSTVVKS